MKLLNLPLYFLFDFDLAFKQFGECTEDIIALLADVVDFLAFDLFQQSRCNLLITLWNHKVDELFVWDSFHAGLINEINKKDAFFFG